MSIKSFFIRGLILTGLLVTAPVYAQGDNAAPVKSAASVKEPASQILDAAYKKARASKKNILVVFHASWCGYCKMLDENLLKDPVMGKLLSSQYEIIELDVLEEGKPELENPGGNAVLARLGGSESGLPFYAVLDATGKKLSDSNRLANNQNIGYPVAPEEITAFVGILKTTAPKLSDADRTKIAEHLKKKAPKDR